MLASSIVRRGERTLSGSISATPDRVFEVVVFLLLLNFLNDRMGRVERVLGPIVFVGLSR